MRLLFEVYDTLQKVKIPMKNIDRLEISFPSDCYITSLPYAVDAKDLEA